MDGYVDTPMVLKLIHDGNLPSSVSAGRGSGACLGTAGTPYLSDIQVVGLKPITL